MSNFSEETVLKVWQKATVVEGANPAEWRKDYAGAWINFKQRGCDHKYGWEIDHQRPVCKGGSDDLDNLKPLHWENNRCKCDDYPRWNTCISSKENANISLTKSWYV